MWEAVERQPGVFDYEYLDKMDVLVKRLGAKGIYTIVDAHQDVFARHICGEGIPNFYAEYDDLQHSCDEQILPEILERVGLCKSMDDYGFRYDEDDNPLIEDCQKNSFPIYYSSPESVSAFNRLYANVDGLKDKFLAFWDAVTKKFSANPYVIGYDPINEPFVSDYFAHPELLLVPGEFDRQVLQPFYFDTF